MGDFCISELAETGQSEIVDVIHISTYGEISTVFGFMRYCSRKLVKIIDDQVLLHRKHRTGRKERPSAAGPNLPGIYD